MTSGQNYGNKLQNYAVQEVLKKLDCEPITIINTTKRGFNIPESYFAKLRRLSPLYILKVINVRISTTFYIKDDSQGFIKSYLWKKHNTDNIASVIQKRKDNFSVFFNKYIKHSDFSISVHDFKKKEIDEFDYFVCGSDQIWNPFYPQNSLIDFLQFTIAKKRIAYAPSFGVSHIPEHKKEIYKKWITEIPYLSVREEKGASIIKELTGRDAKVLVDPTLMLNADEWLSIAEKPDFEVPEKYILTYFLGNQIQKYKKYIQKQANNFGCKIINLNEIREFEHYCVDPSGFIYLINKATLVCTDSFHGTVLSIILKRDFVVFDRVEDGHSMGSRIETLLNKFGFEERRFDLLINANTLGSVDFQHINVIYEQERNKTINFLKKAITGQTQYK